MTEVSSCVREDGPNTNVVLRLCGTHVKGSLSTWTMLVKRVSLTGSPVERLEVKAWLNCQGLALWCEHNKISLQMVEKQLSSWCRGRIPAGCSEVEFVYMYIYVKEMWVSGAPQYCQPDSWRMTLKHLLLVTDFPGSSSKVEVVTRSSGGFTDVNSSSLAAVKSSRVLSVHSVAPAIYEIGVLQETLTLAHALGRRRVKNGS